MQSHLTYDQIHAWSQELAQKVTQDSWRPDLVVGLSRGGVIPGVIISHELHVPLKCMHVSLRDHVSQEPAHWFEPMVLQNKRVLVVDDINDSGDTLCWLREHLTPQLFWCKDNAHLRDHVRFGVLIHKLSSSDQVDYSAAIYAI